MNVLYFVSDSGSSWISRDDLFDDWLEAERGKAKTTTKAGIQILLIFSDHADESVMQMIQLYSKIQCNRCVLVTRHLIPCDQNLLLLEAGLSDIIRWTDRHSLVHYLRERGERWEKIESIMQSDLIRFNLIGSGKAWQFFLRSVIEASLYSRSNLLIIGESGTGKELVSRLVHTLDKREEKTKLVLIDCSTIAPELSGSEFFGHEKGAYTSAINSREGAFSLANDGTLFLDEIGELPMRMQAELLRVIQEGTYKKIGSNNWQNTSFRLVSATNKDLRFMIREKTFRNDLFYRISDVELQVPALNERMEDVIPLSEYFLREFYKEQYPGKEIPEFDGNVKTLLCSRTYLGNVRELRHLVRRVAMRHAGNGYISLTDVPAEDRRSNKTDTNVAGKIAELEQIIRHSVMKGENLYDIKNLAAFVAIKVALELESGSRQKAAERLNITTRAIQQYFKRNNTDLVTGEN